MEMARLWQLMLLGWAWSPLCLPSSVKNESFLGTPEQCARAPFVPGYNLGGEGFDIVKMERKGAYIIDVKKWKRKDGTCTLHNNKHLNRVEKIPVSVVDWRIQHECNLQVSGTIFDSSESLISDSTWAVSNNWKIGLGLHGSSARVALGGSHSREAVFAKKQSKADLYSFLRHSAYCKFYRYRMRDKPPLADEFLQSINSLPSVYSKPMYRSLINTYGTHYIKRVDLGGEMSAITSIRTCKVTMNGLTQTDVKDCLEVEASIPVKKVRVDIMFEHCQKQREKMGTGQSFSSMFNERITQVIGGNMNGADLFQVKPNPDWVNSLKEIPGVVRYSIKPLHTILNTSHPARAGLKKAVESYIMENSLKQKCSEGCSIGHRSSARDRCACVCNTNRYISSNCCPSGKRIATLKVFNLYAKGLYGDVWGKTDGSVVVKYDQQRHQTAVIDDNDNPKWQEVFEFGSITIRKAMKLTFEVYDADNNWNSDLLGNCSFYLHSGDVRNTCLFKYGTFFFSYKVKCAPSLGGPQCEDYIPSPMSSSLTKVFDSRNGVPYGAKSNNQSGFHLPDADSRWNDE